MSFAHFESTLPLGAAELMRASAFQRRMELERDSCDDRVSTRLSSLDPSLHQDLLRFEGKGRRSELLEVLAGAVRHASAVTVHLQLHQHVLALTAFPVQRLVHAVLPMQQFLALQLTELEVLRVEKALQAPPETSIRGAAAMPEHCAPMGKVLWEFALRGARDELLPEIAGQAAYRITPTMDLAALELSGSLASACERLKRQTTSLREIAEWPGFDRTRAMRMLNGLYLQPGLMVSRTHPAATNESWFNNGTH
ncbi:MAG TPA: hypothetical protein PKO45_10730 [Rubrivivax sp.]|nr:hypothetical protein [Rubrivivax sp.]